MRKLALFLCTAFLAFGVDDPWAKLKELKTGTELRVFKKAPPNLFSSKWTN